MKTYNNAAKILSSNTTTPQSQPIPGKEDLMEKNNGGGYSFVVDDWTRLERFLIMGSEGGSYYVSESKLTISNVKGVLNCIAQDGLRVVNKIVEISESGRAMKNTPALFVLALCASYESKEKAPKKDDPKYGQFVKNRSVREAANNALPRVARTASHLLEFNALLNDLSHGWGSGRRRAVASWYNSKPASEVAYQVLKYRERSGLSHKRLISTSHPNPSSPTHGEIYKWIQNEGWDQVGKEPHDNEDLVRIWAFEHAKRATRVDEVVKLIREYNLTQEMIPTNWHGDKKVWEALVERMPMTALIRNLNRLTHHGIISPTSETTKKVRDQITDPEWLKKARIHPMTLLIALKTYAAGRGVKGSLVWTPVPKVVDALDEGFYAAFGAVEPTGKKWKIGLDVSSSMTGNKVNGCEFLSAREASAAMALITYSVEDYCDIVGFSHKLVPVNISNKMRLDDVIRVINNISFGSTDCALPIMHALGYNNTSKAHSWSYIGEYEKVGSEENVDIFCVYTDNETNVGKIHPAEALRRYRKETGNNAKLIVAAASVAKFSIADPTDAGMLDVAGFDSNVPQLMSEFAKS